MSESLIKIGVVTVVYLFSALLAYFLLSTPISSIFSSIETAGSNLQQTSGIMDTIRWAFNIFFAGLAAIPFAYLVAKVMEREPQWRFRRY